MARPEVDPAAKLEPQPPSAATIEATTASPKGNKVTVCCKIPMGLELRLFKPVEVKHPVMGGGFQTVTEHHEDLNAGRVRIKGPAHYMHMAPKAMIVGGYALTPNVDAEFFREWMKQNQSLDAVKNGLIFAQKTPDAAQGMAEERADTFSNLEPMNPEKDRRAPRPLNKQLSPIEQGTTT